MKENLNKYFLPYQIAWLLDESPFKMWEKSRRIGATYVQSYEDVREAVANKWDIWFSSADETAAREYILYCEKWAKVFQQAAQHMGESVLDDNGKSIQVFSIRFKNGRRINALSSSPSQFRSKGGKVVLDEFAWHKDQDGMWAAAEPVTTWGFPLRILSTHNGKNCRFYKLLQDKDKIGVNIHKTTIYDAVEQGLVDKIYEQRGLQKPTEKDTLAWLEDKRRKVGPTVWSQEYCCVPIDESTAFFPYDLIDACQREDLLYGSLDDMQNDFVAGMDIGRRRNLSVIWVAELIDRRRYTRIVDVMENTPFRLQYKRISSYLSHFRCRRCCIDMTGLGEQIAEDALTDFGSFRVEPVRFTNAVKSSIAEKMYSAMEDRDFLFPKEGKLGDTIKEDLHSIKLEKTVSGAHRFDASENEEEPNSHADYFWSAALCNQAYGRDLLQPASVTIIKTISQFRRPTTNNLLSGFRRS